MEQKATLWSALTRRRFRLRLEAALFEVNSITMHRDKSRLTKAATGGVPGAAAALGCSCRRTPRRGSFFESEQYQIQSDKLFISGNLATLV